MTRAGPTLRIAPDLALPIEAVTETFVILAKRGKGKTNTAVVMAEEMISAGQPVVVIDPVGVWWGIKSSADGKHDGLPVAIFGGEHQDVPLESTGGKVVAEVLVKHRVPAVIDLSGFSKSAMRRFMADFLEQLYFQNRDPMHVIVDEADLLAPQSRSGGGPDPASARLLGAMEDMVRRGRARGLGVTLITQRPAVLHKDVLTQAEVLIALGMTGVRDVAAIDEWVKLHGDDTEAAKVKKSLPSLPVGTAWVWSPGWLDILQRTEIRARRTFDSSATPKVGQKRVAVQQMASIDLEELGEKIAATVEQAKANDPAALRAAALKVKADLARSEAEVQRLRAELTQLNGIHSATVTELREVRAGKLPADTAVAVDVLHAKVRPALDAAKDLVIRLEGVMGGISAAPRQRPRITNDPPLPTATKPTRSASAADGSLSKAQTRILTALAQHGPKEKIPLAILTGYSHKGGGFNNPLGALRSAGYVSGRNSTAIAITDEGLAALGDYEPLPTGRALLDWWLPQLSGAEKKIVAALDEHGPMSKPDLAEAAGYSVVGGGFNNPLGHLRTLGIITPARTEPIALAPEVTG